MTPRGSAGLTPALWQLDLHVEYPLRLNQSLQLSLMADVFNVANRKEATAVNQTWTFAALDSTEDPNECGGPGTGPGTSCPQGNPDFGSPVGYQTPRSIRLGWITW